MSTYYVKNGGNDGNSGLSDLLAWETLGKVGGVTLAPDDFVLLKRGSLWRDTLYPPNAGTSGHPITFGAYDTGVNPIISGSDIVTGWTLDSGSIWKATATGQNWHLWINDIHGELMGSKAACVAEYQFFWAADVIYLYAPGDPDTQYTNPGVERPTRYNCLDLSRDYNTWDGLTVEKSGYGGFHSDNPGDYGIIKNCEMRRNDYGVHLGGQTGALYVGWEIHDNVGHHNVTQDISLCYHGTNSKIYRNHCYNTNEWTNEGGAIKIFDDTGTMDYIEIYENYCHDIGRGTLGDYQGGGVGIWSDYVHPPTGSILIHHNFIKDCHGNGLFIEVTSHSRAWGNIVWNCGTNVYGDEAFTCAGIALDCRSTGILTDNLIYNNTVYGGRAGIKLTSYSQGVGMEISHNEVKNNIAIGQTEHRLLAMLGGDNNPTYGHDNIYDYNCFGVEATSFIGWGEGVHKSTYDAWETAYGGSTHSIEADPAFTNAGAGDFTLQAASPCINVGVNLGATYKYGLMHDSVWPAAVILGDQGAHGATWEVGAYIYEVASSPWIVGALAVGGS